VLRFLQEKNLHAKRSKSGDGKETVYEISRHGFVRLNWQTTYDSWDATLVISSKRNRLTEIYAGCQ
jgi:hypothetical protein